VRALGVSRTAVYLVALVSRDRGRPSSGMTRTATSTGAIRAMTTPVHAVCNTTVRAAQQRAHAVYRVRHVGDPTAQLHEARAVLGMTVEYYRQFAAFGDRLAFEPMSRPVAGPGRSRLKRRPACQGSPEGFFGILKRRTKIADSRFGQGACSGGSSKAAAPKAPSVSAPRRGGRRESSRGWCWSRPGCSPAKRRAAGATASQAVPRRGGAGGA
jgi:hypothetical protein